MPGDQMTAAEIARLAGVGRAAVSNWRRRHEDTFPKPVGGPPTSPTFDRAEVAAWLAANGRTPPVQAARGADLAHVVAGLLPPKPKVVLDPACDAGALLAAAAARFGPSTTYLGEDLDTAKVDTARRALTEAGVKADGVTVGSPMTDDTLVRHRGRVDAVVCLPPTRATWPAEEPAALDLPWEFAPPSQLDPYLAWLQICYAYLRPDGVAVLPMPAAAAVRGSGRRVRTNMLRAGALRQVVALPDRFAQLSGPWQIWVLSRPANRPQYTVRMVDLSALPRDEVPDDDAGWRRVLRTPATYADVEAIELLDADVLLLPGRHVEAPVREVGPEYEKLRADLAKVGASLDVKLPTLPRGSGTGRQTLISVTDLVRLGALTILDKAAATYPGDVVVPADPDRAPFVVAVDGGGRTVPGEVLRCDPEALDPYFLTCFLRSDANRRQAAGTLGGTARLDLRRARIPRLPVTEQRPYAVAFRQLSDVTSRLEGLNTLASQAIEAAVYGLTSGTLVPPRNVARDASKSRM
jgi:hypothetical protein